MDAAPSAEVIKKALHEDDPASLSLCRKAFTTACDMRQGAAAGELERPRSSPSSPLPPRQDDVDAGTRPDRRHRPCPELAKAYRTAVSHGIA